MVAYNFPDFDTYQNVSGIWGMRSGAVSFQEKIAQDYPNAETWIMHTGQRQYVPGCEIEVCATVEDFYCSGNALTDGNNTSNAIRINLNGTTIMMLGDIYPVGCKFMADAYGSALESDILQLTHHGFNGGVYALYVNVNPKICFWACDDYRFANDSRNLGQGSCDFNSYVRYTKWTRSDGSSGDRIHYTAERDHTIECKK